MSKTLELPKTLYREATFERGAVNEEERTIELSISSDAPYRRWFGDEILDHSEKSIDMGRMRNGANLLFNHDRSFVLGKIIEARTDGKCLRVKAKMAENSKAQDLWPDIKSGVISKASVGYSVEKMVLEKEGNPKKGEADVYRVTNWRPYEGSLVTIPADDSVGLGRAVGDDKMTIHVGAEKNIENSVDVETQRKQREPNSKNSMSDENKTPVIDVIAERKGAVEAERQRVKEITELATHFRTHGLAGRKIDASELAAQCIRDGKTVQDFQNEAVRGNFAEVKPVETKTPELGMSEKDKRQFSLVRAMRCFANKRPLEGLEKEASEAHAKLIGKDPEGSGFFIPEDVMNGRAYPNGYNKEVNSQIRALFSNVYSGAGALVADDLSAFSLIELLRNQMLVVQMGARSLSGLRGNVPIPRQTGGATASWLAEDSTITATQQTVGQLNLTPHKLAAATAYTQQLLAQSSVDVENFVRQDLMAVIAIARDLAAINGSGVSGQPLGIINTTGLSTNVTLASAESLTYAKAVAFETNVSLNNANVGKLGYLTSIGAKANAKQLAEISAANSNPVWKNDMVNGYPAKATNQMPTATGVLFGNWDDLILASWGENSVIVDPYSLSLQGQVRIVMQMMCDNGLRHAASFAKGTL